MSKAITTLKIKGVSCPVEDAATKAELAETNTLLNTTKQSFEQFKEDTSSSLESIESGDAIVNKAYNDENGNNLADTLELATETKTAFEAFKTSAEAALDTKLSKVTRTHNVAGLVYGVMNDGSQTTFNLTTTANACTIPYRLSDGSINVGTPTADTNATTKKYVDDKLTRAALIEVIGKATSSLDGIMSKEDKGHLDTLVALMEDDDNAVVDKIHEIIAIFNQYPEGTEIATTLSNLNTKIKNVEDNKVDTSTYNTKVGELEEADASLSDRIDDLKSNTVGELETRVGDLESTIETKANTSAIPTKVSQLENDSSYITSSTLSGYNYATKTDLNSYVTNAIYTNEVNRLEDDISNLQDEVGTKANTSALNDYALKSSLSSKADVGASYTKTESEAKYQPKGDYATSSTLGNYATTSALNDAISGVKDDVSSMIEDSYQPKGNYVKTVNNSEPDTAGNVTITIPDYSQDISGIKDGTISVGKAIKAVSDKNNNDITTTYQKKLKADDGINLRSDGTISSYALRFVDSDPEVNGTTYNYKNLYYNTNDKSIKFVTRDINDTVLLKSFSDSILPFKVDGLSVAKYVSNGITYAYLFGGRYFDERTGMYKYNSKVYRFNTMTGFTTDLDITAPFTSENSEAVTIGDYIYVFANNPSSEGADGDNVVFRFDINNYSFDYSQYFMESEQSDMTKLRNISVVPVGDKIYVLRKNAIHMFDTLSMTMYWGYRTLEDINFSGGYATLFNGKIYATGNNLNDNYFKLCVIDVDQSTGNLGSETYTEYTTIPCYKYYTGYLHNEYLFLVGGEIVKDSNANMSDYIRRINLVTGKEDLLTASESYTGRLEDARGISFTDNDTGIEYFVTFGGSDADSALDTVSWFSPKITYENNQITTSKELNTVKSSISRDNRYNICLICKLNTSGASNINVTITYPSSSPNQATSIDKHLNTIFVNYLIAEMNGPSVFGHISTAQGVDLVLSGINVSSMAPISITGMANIASALTLQSVLISQY